MRILIIQRIILVAVALLWGALFSFQVIHGGEYREKSEKNRTRLIPLPASRGAILDRRGVPLAEDRMSFELAAFPQEIKDPGDLWKKLQPLVGKSPEAMAKAYRKGFRGPFSPVSIVKDLSNETAFRIEEDKTDLPGVMVRPVPKRDYPLGAAQGSALGYLGIISQDELTLMKSYGYSYRDYVGKDGLEQMYDNLLRGKPGGLLVEVNARGKMVRQLGFRKSETGRRITVSLDGRLQEFCYKLLDEKPGAIVVMDNATGEILALVSSPSFDPNAFLDTNRSEEVRRYLHSPRSPMFNRTIWSTVPPASTFKVAVASYALQMGKISRDTTFECRGFFQLGARVFKCWWAEGHGSQTVTDALEHSCDVFFYNTGRRLRAEGIVQAARLFGLGTRTGIDLRGENNGFVPDPAWMKEVVHQPWQEGDTLSFGIGQGALTATPLQVMMLFAILANNGYAPQPHLLLKVEGEPEVKVPKGRQVALRPDVIACVKEGMERVVSSDTGTGRLAQLSGIPVAGKTGTAQVTKGLSHAWFGGYAPADHPKVSFVVFLDHGGRGGAEAAFLARDMLVRLHELGYI